MDENKTTQNEGQKLAFQSDYMEGAHPAIIKKLAETNLLHTSGYGSDEFCEEARTLIRKACETPDAQIQFLTGGTQTNSTVIDCLLKKWQGVIAAESGHVAVHEAGAVEYTGHKVIALKAQNGKLSAKTIESYIKDFYADANWNTWLNREWSTFPSQQNSEQFTQNKNFPTFQKSAVNTKFHFLPMEHDLPMRSEAKKTT